MREKALSASHTPSFAVEAAFRDGIAEIAIRGDLDVLTAPVLDDMLALALNKRPSAIVLDFSGVEFLDCAAVRVIARVAAARPARGWLTIRHPSLSSRRLLLLTGVEADILMDPREHP
jgi:anti-sigma B factor antagonist